MKRKPQFLGLIETINQVRTQKRNTEQLTFGDHLVQHPCSKSSHLEQVAQGHVQSRTPQGLWTTRCHVWPLSQCMWGGGDKKFYLCAIFCVFCVFCVCCLLPCHWMPLRGSGSIAFITLMRCLYNTHSYIFPKPLLLEAEQPQPCQPPLVWELLQFHHHFMALCWTLSSMSMSFRNPRASGMPWWCELGLSPQISTPGWQERWSAQRAGVRDGPFVPYRSVCQIQSPFSHSAWTCGSSHSERLEHGPWIALL